MDRDRILLKRLKSTAVLVWNLRQVKPSVDGWLGGLADVSTAAHDAFCQPEPRQERWDARILLRGPLVALLSARSLHDRYCRLEMLFLAFVG